MIQETIAIFIVEFYLSIDSSNFYYKTDAVDEMELGMGGAGGGGVPHPQGHGNGYPSPRPPMGAPPIPGGAPPLPAGAPPPVGYPPGSGYDDDDQVCVHTMYIYNIWMFLVVDDTCMT